MGYMISAHLHALRYLNTNVNFFYYKCIKSHNVLLDIKFQINGRRTMGVVDYYSENWLVSINVKRKISSEIYFKKEQLKTKDFCFAFDHEL